MPDHVATEIAQVALYAKAKTQRFSAGQAAQLDQKLGEIDEGTQVLPIDAVEDLLLNPNGATAVGYRYTSLGFNQVAYELSPGLSTLVPDMAGCVRRYQEQVELFDLSAAVNVFNTVLALRFELLKRHRIIYNTKQRLIEGLIGPKHQYSRNRELYACVSEVMEDRSDIAFYAAELVGRRLTIWYRGLEPAFRTSFRSASHPFWCGYYFVNGESAGTCLRGTDVMINKHGCAVGSFRAGTRISHVGRNFQKRASRLFRRVIERELSIDKYSDGAQQLVACQLGVVGSQDDREKRIGQLVHVLCRRKGVGKWVAQDVVQNALLVGADDKELQQLALLHPEPYRQRTAYDLFCALLRRSRQLNLERREILEQAAYELMLGQLKLGER